VPLYREWVLFQRCFFIVRQSYKQHIEESLQKHAADDAAAVEAAVSVVQQVLQKLCAEERDRRIAYSEVSARDSHTYTHTHTLSL
jgi:hypothetical protein